MNRSQIGAVKIDTAVSSPVPCPGNEEFGTLIDSFAQPDVRAWGSMSIRSSPPTPTSPVTSDNCRLSDVYMISSILGPSIASSREVAIVLYNDLTRLWGAKLDAEVIDADMSELSAGRLELGLREKKDWSGGEAQSIEEDIRDYSSAVVFVLCLPVDIARDQHDVCPADCPKAQVQASCWGVPPPFS